MACGRSHYPRTNPVAIVLVLSRDGQRCVLGQSRGRQQQMRLFSALAGFVDQAESLEDAVRREVKEESGLELVRDGAAPGGGVVYHSSQPWPFPCNLMLGCVAWAAGEALSPDLNEMADVRWFAREDVSARLAALEAALDGGADAAVSALMADDGPGAASFVLPTRIAIANTLLHAWIAGAFDGKCPPAGGPKLPSSL